MTDFYILNSFILANESIIALSLCQFADMFLIFPSNPEALAVLLKVFVIFPFLNETELFTKAYFSTFSFFKCGETFLYLRLLFEELRLVIELDCLSLRGD